jgi:hypothetical protein
MCFIFTTFTALATAKTTPRQKMQFAWDYNEESFSWEQNMKSDASYNNFSMHMHTYLYSYEKHKHIFRQKRTF